MRRLRRHYRCTSIITLNRYIILRQLISNWRSKLSHLEYIQTIFTNNKKSSRQAVSSLEEEELLNRNAFITC